MNIKSGIIFILSCILTLSLSIQLLDSDAFLFFNSQNNDIAVADISNRKLLNAKSTESVSFFEIYTSLNTVQTSPDLDINNSLSGGYSVENQNGFKTFLRCSNNLSFNGVFEFFDPAASTYPSGTSFFIDWGDGDTSTQVETHTYSAGFYTLSYSVILPNGTTNTNEFKVFVGTEPPSVSVSLSSSTTCLDDEYEFTVRVDNNTPSTTYRIVINDGSDPYIINSSDYPIGDSFTKIIQHTFLDNSCESISVIDGDDVNNAFSVTAIATNPCSQEGTFSVTGPIRVSTPTEANLELPGDVACVNSIVNFRDISTSGTNTDSESCNGEYGRYWEITSLDGNTVEVQPGSELGSDDGAGNDWASWTDGTENIEVLFSSPGFYTITIVTANNCGISRETKQICIVDEVKSNFSLTDDEVCLQDNLIISTTNESIIDECISPRYEWTVTANNEDCLPSEPSWEFANGTNQFDEEPEFQFNTAGVYTVSLNVFGDILEGGQCSDDFFEQVIVVKDSPKAELEDLVVCENEPFNINPVIYDCYSSDGTSYSWDFGASSPASISSSSDPNPEISYSSPGNYTYDLTITNECGTETFTRNIEVLVSPTVNASGPTAVCKDEEILLDGDITGGTGDIFWTSNIPGGSFNPNNEALNPTYTPPLGYTGEIIFTLTADNSETECSETIDTHIVEVELGPEVSTGSYDPICKDSSIILNGSFGGSASSITWTSSDGGIFADSTNPNTEFTPPSSFTGTLTLTITSNDPTGVCSPASESVDIEILPDGQVNPLPDLEVCNTEDVSAINFTSSNSDVNTEFEWEIDLDIGLSPQTGTGNLPVFTAMNLTENPITATVTVTPTTVLDDTQCIGTPEVFTITVDPAPIINDTQINICDGDDFDYDPSSDVVNFVPAGSTYTWDTPISDPPGAITGGTDETSPQSSVFNSQPLTKTIPEEASLTYTVTPTLGDCESEAFTVTVSFEAEPVIQDINVEACSGEEFIVNPDDSIVGNFIPEGTTYTWTAPSINPPGSISGATAQSTPVDSINQLLENTTSNPATATYTVTPQHEGCLGESFNIIVELENFGSITQQPLASQNVCQEGLTTTLEVDYQSVNSGTVFYQWYVSSTADNTSGTPINGQTANTFTPPSSNIGTLYYYVEITQDNSTCRVTSDLAEVVVNAQPELLEQPQSEELCINAPPSTLSVEAPSGFGNISYQWFENDTESNTGGSLIPGADESTFTPPSSSESGNFYYYVELEFDNPGCESTISEPATLTFVPFAELNEQEDIVVCNGSETSAIEFTTTNPAMDHTYEWTNDNPDIGLPSNGNGNIPEFIATNTTSNPITATITVNSESELNGFACGSSNIQFTITVPPAIEVNATFSDYDGFQVSCFDANDGSIQINGSNAYTYAWTGPNGFTSNQQNIVNLNQGEYVLEVTDEFGCTTEFIYQLEAPDEILITEDAVSSVFCHDDFTGQILISVTGGTGSYTYTWLKDGVSIDTSQDLTNIGAGQYTVIVEDQRNCRAVRDFEVTEPSPIEIDIVDSTAFVCASGSNVPDNLNPGDYNGIITIDVEGGTPLQTGPNDFSYQFEWFDTNGDLISNEQNLTGVTPGVYTVNVTDNLGCIVTEVIEIAEPEPITTIVSTENETCVGAQDGTISIDIQGGSPPYTVEWNTGDTGPTLSNLAPGFYEANITDKYNCFETVSVEIESAEPLVVDINLENISCFGSQDGFIDAIASGGRAFDDGSYNYQWSGPDGFTNSQPTIQNLVEGTYQLTVSDANNCLVNREVTIEEPEEFIVNYTSTDVNCFGSNDGSITITAQGGTPPYTSSLGSINGSNFTFDNLDPGNYDIEVMDDNGCLRAFNIQIEQNFNDNTPSPTGETFQEFCLEDQITVSDLEVSGSDVRWFLNSTDSNPLPPDYLITESSTLYARNLSSDSSCLSQEFLRVEVNIIEGIVEVNNYISINGNDANTKLNIVNIENFPDNEVQVYNRYGKLVWETRAYHNQDNAFIGESNVGGTINSSNFLPTGTYYYVLSYNSSCRNNSKKGFLQIDNNTR